MCPWWSALPSPPGSSEQNLRGTLVLGSRLGACSFPACGLSILNQLCCFLLGAGGPWKSYTPKEGHLSKGRACSKCKEQRSFSATEHTGQGQGKREADRYIKGALMFHDKQNCRTAGWPWVVSCLSAEALKPVRMTSCQKRS